MTLELERLDPSPDAEAFASPFFGAAMRGEDCVVHGFEDFPHRLPMSRWNRPADSSDAAVLSHCDGPALDIGCGPGRMSAHLTQRGIGVLGIDIVPEAVASTRARGASALHRDVFDQLPGEGSWVCALLADGNIGIGGDPVQLLRRVGALLAPGGTVVADLAPPGTALQTRSVVLECGGAFSQPFSWSILGPEAVHSVAAAAGLRVASLHAYDGRWFVVLVKRA